MFTEKISAILATTESIIQNSANAACANGDNCGGSFEALLADVTNTLIFIIGAVSVIMIIVGALRFVISNGDSKQIESARYTVLYAIIGIVVAIASYAIVAFVTKNIH